MANPTHRSTWKAFERLVADFFGTRRTPLSGSNSGHNTTSDTLHPEVYVECKYRAKMAVYELFNDTVLAAKLEEKIPVVAIKQKGEKGYLLVMRSQDLHRLAELSHHERPAKPKFNPNKPKSAKSRKQYRRNATGRGDSSQLRPAAQPANRTPNRWSR